MSRAVRQHSASPQPSSRARPSSRRRVSAPMEPSSALSWGVGTCHYRPIWTLGTPNRLGA